MNSTNYTTNSTVNSEHINRYKYFYIHIICNTFMVWNYYKLFFCYAVVKIYRLNLGYEVTHREIEFNNV